MDGESSWTSFFVTGSDQKFQLRNGVSIHLVLSDAPNGDARDFLPADTNKYFNAYDSVTEDRTLKFLFKQFFVNLSFAEIPGTTSNSFSCSGF